MASKPYSPESSVVRERLSVARRFCANVAIARVQGLLDMGVRAGDGVALLARNHRWFLIANFGAARGSL